MALYLNSRPITDTYLRYLILHSKQPSQLTSVYNNSTDIDKQFVKVNESYNDLYPYALYKVTTNGGETTTEALLTATDIDEYRTLMDGYEDDNITNSNSITYSVVYFVADGTERVAHQASIIRKKDMVAAISSENSKTYYYLLIGDYYTPVEFVKRTREKQVIVDGETTTVTENYPVVCTEPEQEYDPVTMDLYIRMSKNISEFESKDNSLTTDDLIKTIYLALTEKTAIYNSVSEESIDLLSTLLTFNRSYTLTVLYLLYQGRMTFADLKTFISSDSYKTRKEFILSFLSEQDNTEDVDIFKPLKQKLSESSNIQNIYEGNILDIAKFRSALKNLKLNKAAQYLNYGSYCLRNSYSEKSPLIKCSEWNINNENSSISNFLKSTIITNSFLKGKAAELGATLISDDSINSLYNKYLELYSETTQTLINRESFVRNYKILIGLNDGITDNDISLFNETKSIDISDVFKNSLIDLLISKTNRQFSTRLNKTEDRIDSNISDIIQLRYAELFNDLTPADNQATLDYIFDADVPTEFNYLKNYIKISNNDELISKIFSTNKLENSNYILPKILISPELFNLIFNADFLIKRETVNNSTVTTLTSVGQSGILNSIIKITNYLIKCLKYKYGDTALQSEVLLSSSKIKEGNNYKTVTNISKYKSYLKSIIPKLKFGSDGEFYGTEIEKFYFYYARNIIYNYVNDYIKSSSEMDPKMQIKISDITTNESEKLFNLYRMIWFIRHFILNANGCIIDILSDETAQLAFNDPCEVNTALENLSSYLKEMEKYEIMKFDIRTSSVNLDNIKTTKDIETNFSQFKLNSSNIRNFYTKIIKYPGGIL